MSTTLLVDPPFTREEWTSTSLEDLMEGPMGRRLAAYIALYRDAVVRQGREGIEALLASAGFPAVFDRPITVDWLRGQLQLFASRDAAGVDALEQLLVVVHFVDYLAAEGARLDKPTRDWTDVCRQLAFVTLFACINDHFGIAAG